MFSFLTFFAARVVVTCHGDDKFLLNSTLVDIDQLGCVGNPAEAELLQDQTGG